MGQLIFLLFVYQVSLFSSSWGRMAQGCIVAVVYREAISALGAWCSQNGRVANYPLVMDRSFSDRVEDS